MIFLDTSAIYALADEGDENHEKAKELFELALSQSQQFFLHNYILIEAGALLQRRLGLEQIKQFLKEATRFHTIWIDSSLHKLTEDYFYKNATRKLSFVDCTSFVVMRQQGITEAFAFDDDFQKAGFRLYGK
ncbi:MAG TPA: PIN domain-containing protein [Candidatus Paceibacterota bacterium]